jgi:hypothetical protein
VTAASRIAAFALGLAAVFALAALAGRALDVAPRSLPDDEAHAAATGGEARAVPAGLSLSEDGVTLVAQRSVRTSGRREPFVFRLVDGEDRVVRDFDVVHEREMHLIVVRRDLTGFQHLHPKQARDGSWSTPLALELPGAYRAFADFETDGDRRTLGVDLVAPGDVAPRPLPPPSATARTGPYAVTLAREGALLRFRVRRDGQLLLPEPYLGARGHLVVLREGDLAFVHAHPEEGATAGGGALYEAELPSAGRYALFLQFSHGGAVRTVRFTVEQRP